jgi:hypothetical protein
VKLGCCSILMHGYLKSRSKVIAKLLLPPKAQRSSNRLGVLG